MTNFEKITTLNRMASIITYVDELMDAACTYNADLNEGKCPHGEEIPPGDQCQECNVKWLLAQTNE